MSDEHEIRLPIAAARTLLGVVQWALYEYEDRGKDWPEEEQQFIADVGIAAAILKRRVDNG